MYKYYCTNYACKEKNVSWSEFYVNNRTNGRNIRERREQMEQVHKLSFDPATKHKIVRRKVS